MARIILTRPAVEAGERLGFLPGDMLAKVDPYLRPLFDALYDMLDPERANTYMERGTIEVAPLAFMRGRAQPLSSHGPDTGRAFARSAGYASVISSRFRRAADRRSRRLSAGSERGLPRADTGRRVDALLR